MSVILKTTGVGKLKTVFDTMKDLITDVNLHFNGDWEKEAGAVIAEFDNSKLALVYFFLDKREIDKSGFYKCSKPCFAGINLPAFYKKLKVIKDHDTMTMEMNPEQPEVLSLRLDNNEKQKRGAFDIKLMDIDQTYLEIPDEVFDMTIALDSAEFQQMCRDVNTVDAERARITVSQGEVTMRAEGDDGSAEISLGAKRDAEPSESSGVGVVSNEYPLKFLMQFAKASKLSQTVRIRIKDNFPIMMDYQIPSIGLLRFCLSPFPSDDDECTAEPAPTVKRKSPDPAPTGKRKYPDVAPPPSRNARRPIRLPPGIDE